MRKFLLAGLAALWIVGLTAANAESVHICKFNIDSKEKVGDSGSSLHLEYDVDAENAFNGFWMKLGPADRGNNFDASGYTTLTLQVKGSKTAGMPAKFKIEVKGDAGDVIGGYYIGNLSSEWTKIEIPLASYAKQGVQLAALNELTIVFENKAAIPGVKGSIWVDDIKLEGGDKPQTIADFNNSDHNNLGGKFGVFTP